MSSNTRPPGGVTWGNAIPYSYFSNLERIRADRERLSQLKRSIEECEADLRNPQTSMAVRAQTHTWLKEVRAAAADIERDLTPRFDALNRFDSMLLSVLKQRH